MTMHSVVVHTDGACLGNPGPGGYCAVIEMNDIRIEKCGGFRLTTNNRMEIMAAIIGLGALEDRCKVVIFSDSQYLVRAITEGWARKWQVNGWMRNKKEPALNPDLWNSLLELCQRHDVEFRWVRGHSNHAENERCDRLANEAARHLGLPPDVVYELQIRRSN